MDRNRGCFSDTRKTAADRAALHQKIFCSHFSPKTLPHNYQKFMTALQAIPILTSD
jgi:hypothetical protein